MNWTRKRILLLCLLVGMLSRNATAQERLAPLGYNPVQYQQRNHGKNIALKTTALTLPFFEDFTDHYFPDTNKWEDRYVYVNNTMCVNPISRGVATFDALNQYGLPYDPDNNARLLYADSLTSRPFDLSGHVPGDSIYLSFFYQPQGNGFYPEASDSLFVYLKKNTTTGAWVKVWSVAGTQLQPFRQAMIPVRNDEYFHDNFQFRFVNKASINTNDDVWNVDYIRMNTGRNLYDTLVNDIAFTTDPTYLLNDYTYMPYHQFMADPAKELAANHTASIRNNSNVTQTFNYGYNATEQVSGAFLSSGNGNSLTLNPGQASDVTFPVYTNNIPATGGFQTVVFENKYYLENTPVGDPKLNDTIVREQRFDNYLAYDDGTAEKSYYLNLFTTLPGKTAIEYHLNRKDTMLGIAIYFGRQVPMAYNKDFSVVVYKNIGIGGGADQIAYQQDFLYPGYLLNDQYYYYKFDNPVVLDQGTFYTGTIQPAGGVSDSLYIGLDANRTGGNHLYYNVSGFWESSTVSGALMMRPVFGWIIPSNVAEVAAREPEWALYPNPANDITTLSCNFQKSCIFELSNTQGRIVMSGNADKEMQLDISGLIPGMYFIRLRADGITTSPRKFIKL